MRYNNVRLTEEMTRAISNSGAVAGVSYSPNLLVNKYSYWINKINEDYKAKNRGAELPTYKKYYIATLMENTNRLIDNVDAHQKYYQSGVNTRKRGLNEAINPSNISGFKKFNLDVTAVTSYNSIIELISSAQPQLMRNGQAHYLNVTAGSTKSGVQAGQTLFSNFEGPADAAHYADDQVKAAVFSQETGVTEYQLNWLPVIKGTVKGTIAGVGTVLDDGQGHLVNGSTTVATIDYNTGVITFSSVTAGTQVALEYVYDNINLHNGGIQAPELDVRIEAVPMTAVDRKLKTLFSIDALFDMGAEFNYTLDKELENLAAQELRHETDQAMIDELVAGAKGEGVDWNIVEPYGVPTDIHYRSFAINLSQIGSKMFTNTRKYKPNFYIVGELGSVVISSLPKFVSSQANDTAGPHLMGTLDGKNVFHSPYMNSDKILAGYKGDSLFDSGALYGPYIPFTSTAYLVDNFAVKRGYMRSDSMVVVNGNMYANSTITSQQRVIETHANS
jgi:hypothetical protein